MSRRPFFSFDQFSHETWSLLYARQRANCEVHGTRLWLDGVEAMGISGDRIPDFERISNWLKPRVGWELLSTEIQFSSSEDWFDHLERRIFLITEYIRGRDALDYTPLPDIWHDAFGHLPFLADQQYVNLLQRFGEVFNRAPVEVRRSLGNLWWYAIEFGLMREGGEVKALGTGLMSSPGELKNAFTDNCEHVPFTLEEVMQTATSHHTFHKRLFILESLDHLEDILGQWVKRHMAEPALA